VTDPTKKEAGQEGEESEDEPLEPAHPLDGGAIHGHHAPERLTVAQRLEREAAAEDHQEVEAERGPPPHGKL
jgi:hypothetical protein